MTEICGRCRGPWPCDCSPEAVPIVMIESVDDDYATALARRMADKDAPLSVRAYDLDPPIRVQFAAGGLDEHCAHYQGRFDLDDDKRIVWCRQCGAILDPYWVLVRVANIDRRLSERLAALQELEKRETVREAERKARARQRRHRYALYSRRGVPEHCATCGMPRENPIHEAAR